MINPKTPELYAQEETKDPIVYTIINCLSSRWLITEYDPQTQIAFGWCEVISGEGELGYANVEEIKELPYPVTYTSIEEPLSSLT